MMNEVCAVIVTYNCDETIIKGYKSIKNQVKHTVIVDNGSNKESLKRLTSLKNDKLTIIYNQDNLGIGKALNLAMDFAVKNNFRWLLTMDQDSILPENFIDVFQEIYTNIKNKQEIAILAPDYFDGNTGERAKFLMKTSNNFFYRRKTCEGLIEPLIVIQSGSLFNLAVLKKVGGFREDLFIDYVDNEICLRLNQEGYKIVVTDKIKMKHHLGNRNKKVFLGYTFYPTNYSPIRKYYNARNRIYLYKEYAKKNFPWFIYDVTAFLYDLLRVALFEDEKINKFKYILKGIKDGFQNKLGRFN
ncbi:glycosyltransferase family 2 protein [Geobacillus sp. FSL K6-0789]|uniref:glycosyltransferase family 2 protein n=1 Tax=Geobacillus sp. FSL K6-0789 TaxID=2954744 RepID=UPI00315864A1